MTDGSNENPPGEKPDNPYAPPTQPYPQGTPPGQQPEQPWSQQPGQHGQPGQPGQPWGQQPGQPTDQPQYGQPAYGQQPGYGGYPPAGYPQPGYPAYPGYGYATGPRTDGGATTALVVGIVALAGAFFTCGVTLLGGPVAWIVGALAKRRIDASQGRLAGRGNAQAGMILGIVSTVLLVLAVAGAIAAVLGAFGTIDWDTSSTTETGTAA